MRKRYKVAIVGATGLVGRTALKVLEEKAFPNIDYTLFCSSKSAGTKLSFLGQTYSTVELKENSFDAGYDFAIFSAGGETSKKFAPIAASKGCIVIDNSNAFRMNSDVPLVVPEVNPEKIWENKGIISNPNCSTIQAVVPLKPLDDNYKIKRIVYSTYQAVSGAGRPGIEDLENGIKGEEPQKFPYPIFNNCLPHIDVFMEDGYTKEEHKMINETRKILGKPNLPITATTVRVPVINCHSESINVEFEKDFHKYVLLFTDSNVYYFSLLRPMSELQIAGYFSKFPKFHKVFRSCNAGSKEDKWCAGCSKCLFVSIILSPFLWMSKTAFPYKM